VRPGVNDRAKFAALHGLRKMAEAHENCVPLYSTPGLHDAIMLSLSAKAVAFLHEQALALVRNLGAVRSTSGPLCKAPGLVDALVRLMAKGETRQVRLSALGVIHTLAEDLENAVLLCGASGLLYTIVRTLSGQTTSDEVALFAAGVIFYLVMPKRNIPTLRATPGLVEVVVNIAHWSANSNLKCAAFLALIHLGRHIDGMGSLCETPGLIDALVRGLQRDQDPEVTIQALNLVDSLAAQEESLPLLRASANLMHGIETVFVCSQANSTTKALATNAIVLLSDRVNQPTGGT